MNLRSALLFCATVATLMPCCAQATTPALEARLRARISELSPQLTDNGHNPEQDDKLALSLAQLGDETAALALADTPDAQDEIWQWRTEQSALRGDWKAAKQAAQHVQNASVRADGFLVIARLACEKSDLVVARAALLEAMPVLDKAPASNQLAYAAWIWWRAGDVAAARRVLLDKAWPTALREDEADAKEWQRVVPTLPLSKRQTVIEFAASCGLLRDVLKRFDPDNKLSVQWMTANASDPADLQFLFERVLSEQPTRPTALYTVALSLARCGAGVAAARPRAKRQDH